MTATVVARTVLERGGLHGNATRIAAVLGRTRLEEIIGSVVGSRYLQMWAATGRSRLIYLGVIDRSAAALAATAWYGLSEACHHHAFDLSPTSSEVEHLLDLVDQFAELDLISGTTRMSD